MMRNQTIAGVSMLQKSPTMHPVFACASACVLHVIENPLPGGFPSPAQDYLEDEIDLSGYLIRNPACCHVHHAGQWSFHARRGHRGW